LNQAIAIFIELIERLAKLCLLLLGGEVTSHES